MMRAGKLRHRIEIQKVTESTDSVSGEVTREWTTIETVWGSIRPMRGTERFEASQVSPQATHKVNLRYDSRITSAHRLRFNSRIFGIEFPLNVNERNIELELLCKEAL